MTGDGGSDPERLLEVAIEVTGLAADLVRSSRETAITDVGTKSTPTDVVTAADKAAERLVIDALAESRPGDAVLGEETGSHGDGPARPDQVRWVLDPIDGTVNYLYGLPQYGVSLAAEVGGSVVAGVVRCPATGGLWTAVRGQGAYSSGRRLTGSGATELSQTLVATGFAYDRDRRAYQARVLAGLLPDVRDVRRIGAAALDLCFAAEGWVDAYYEKGLGPWDLAAGALIAAEAGLRVTGLAGAAAGPAMVIAAPPGVYDALHNRLVELDAGGGP